MKCSKCGKEIAKDSNFCEYCGNPIKKSQNKTIWIALAVIFISLTIIVVLSGTLFGNNEVPTDSLKAEYYVDLGLPSGTLWKTINETGFYTYEEAVSQFGTRLPTKEQWEELKSECQWQWAGDGYEIIGNNGNTMTLPATGWRGFDGSVNYLGSRGNYWSSTPSGSKKAWYLGFVFSEVVMLRDYCRAGISVRLVQD